MTARDEAIEAEPQRDTLYLFDWKTAPTRQWKSLPDESGTELGWFNGHNWVAALGRGVWSAEFITAFRLAFVIDQPVPLLLNDLADRIEDERIGDEIDDWNVALIKAAETVRAAAEGWRTD